MSQEKRIGVRELIDKYGLLLDVEDVADVFGYSDAEQVRYANRTKSLPVTLRRFEGRRRLFATPRDVATALEKHELLNVITEKYGMLLDTQDVAEIFRLKSPEAVRKSIANGSLPIEMKNFPGRRKLFSTACQVARALEDLQEN